MQKMVMVKVATEHAEKAKGKYQMLADCLESKVQTYNDEMDKLKYLRALAHMTDNIKKGKKRKKEKKGKRGKKKKIRVKKDFFAAIYHVPQLT